MKHLLIICSLFAIGLNMSAVAQDEISKTTGSTIHVEEDSDGGFNVKLDFDDEIDDDKKIKKVTDLIGEFDSEIGKELELELNGLSQRDKNRLIEKLDEGFSFDSDMDGLPAGVVLIALPAVILIFGMPLFLLLALLGAGNRKRKQKMELVDLYIKSERDIPEHVITALDNGGAASSLKSGLTLTAVGLGVVAAFNILGAEEAGAFGLIPMFLGIARLIFWFVVERKSEPEADLDS
jgi:hypothetical protein